MDLRKMEIGVAGGVMTLTVPIQHNQIQHRFLGNVYYDIPCDKVEVAQKILDGTNRFDYAPPREPLKVYRPCIFGYKIPKCI